jgi:hypothetical protein
VPAINRHLHPSALADKLAKVCGMFGSDHDGEVVVAARTAHRIVKEAGATWPQILMPALPAPEPQGAAADAAWRPAIAFCLENLNQLDERDATFIRSIHAYRRKPSAPQLKWLGDCYRKLVARGCRP